MRRVRDARSVGLSRLALGPVTSGGEARHRKAKFFNSTRDKKEERGEKKSRNNPESETPEARPEG